MSAAPSVKPLIWEERGAKPTRWWRAYHAGREVYSIFEYQMAASGPIHSIYREHQHHWKDTPTLAEAQAAAQADWETFIRSALA